MKKDIILFTTIVMTILLTIWSIIITQIATDLRDRTISQEEYIKELEWENENNYMYCLGREE